MIPAITPPTDNLYKFISLFGLTIFLFAVYNLSIVFDRISVNSIKIEDLKSEVSQNVCATSPSECGWLDDGSSDKIFFRLFSMNADLQKTNEKMQRSNLNSITKIKLNGKIKKLNVELNALNLKLWSYVIICIGGAFIMRRGFKHWQKREQNLRDRILEIEHLLKEREQQMLIIQATADIKPVPPVGPEVN